jgi:hypothetical protein
MSPAVTEETMCGEHGELDRDRCLEVLCALILDRGKVVYRLLWDSGGLGSGAGEEVVYKFEDLYWPHLSDMGLSGSYDSLREALSGAFLCVMDSTYEISSKELTGERLVELLQVDAEPGYRLGINRATWEVSAEGKLERRKRSKGGTVG